MPRNLTEAQGIACPQCHQMSECDDAACSCPACFTLWNTPDAIAAWIDFAPVMVALNEDDVDWLWARDHRTPPRYGLELEFDERHSISIERSGSRWTADLHTRTVEHPPEWDVTNSTLADTPEDISSWVCRAISDVLG